MSNVQAAIKRNGDIWLSTPAVEIHTTDGRVDGVTVVRDGQRVRIETDLVISNAGPKATAKIVTDAILAQRPLMPQPSRA